MVPGGARGNYASYGERIDLPEGYVRDLMCDPQTSGGLLVAVAPEHAKGVEQLLSSRGMPSQAIGRMLSAEERDLDEITVTYRATVD